MTVMHDTETALLTAARAWFDVWAASEGRLSASQAACLPEFHPLLTAMVEDSDARVPTEAPVPVSSCDPAVTPERTDA